MKQLFLVTGFLGAGKTTFLHVAMGVFAGRRVAVIVNEFGKRGVDGGLLAARGYNVTEIANGSVFCVCRMDMFIEALARAAKAPIDVLLVETSGLSNPTNIGDILAQTEKITGERFDFRGCVCLVDALNFEKVLATAVVVPDQVRQSSLVVINKCDLAGPEKIKQVEGLIRGLNPDCAIHRTSYADIPAGLLLELKPIPGRVLGGRQDLQSGSLTFRVLGRPGLESFRRTMDAIKHLVYRCKGCAVLAEGLYEIDGVMDEIAVAPAAGERPEGVVLLYRTAGHVRKALRQAAAENGVAIAEE